MTGGTRATGATGSTAATTRDAGGGSGNGDGTAAGGRLVDAQAALQRKDRQIAELSRQLDLLQRQLSTSGNGGGAVAGSGEANLPIALYSGSGPLAAVRILLRLCLRFLLVLHRCSHAPRGHVHMDDRKHNWCNSMRTCGTLTGAESDRKLR